MDWRAKEEDVEKMKQHLAKEREKYGYSLEDPVNPIADKNTRLRTFLSIAWVALAAIAIGVLLVVIALINTGKGDLVRQLFHI